MSLPSTIAVDGPAGSGKSSVSFAVAQRIGYLFVDTGAFYRAITLLAHHQQINPSNAEDVIALAQRVRLDMTPDLGDDDRQFTFLADGQDITRQLHTRQMDQYVSIVAANSGVRAAILDTQRQLAARGKVIMAGRDIGSVVLPHADLKIYIDASLDARAERRYKQRLAATGSADLDTVREGLRSRDEIDRSRETAPLLKPEDAVPLDTSNLTLAQSIDAAHQIIKDWQPPTE
ncbi:MAG: (d)CMP kinase [Anaerolineae bacterium]|nr:(d)CMP kinase [Anaerolineae bacterium]